MPKPTFGVEDVRDMLRQAVFLFEVAKPDIRFSISTPDDIEPLVCDRRLLSQALMNIVKNAVEAIEEDAKKSEHDGSGEIDAATNVLALQRVRKEAEVDVDQLGGAAIDGNVIAAIGQAHV